MRSERQGVVGGAVQPRIMDDDLCDLFSNIHHDPDKY